MTGERTVADRTDGRATTDRRLAGRRILELGGGRDPVPGAVNMDIADVPEVDIIADVTGEWPVEPASFDRIEAHHVLEHVSHDDLPGVFRRASETLRPGGRFHVEVPLAHSRSAKNDPTHRSEWYWRTPSYYAGGDELAYEVDADLEFALERREIRLFLTSGEWFARPPSWLLKQLSLRNPSLIELVKLPYVTGFMEFTMRKRG
ncbi:class I SAM-dependent methyltransferase [Natronoarchaeum mannanilyticum]|uniref:Methyltransferase domain-containing protein n=1 Tax=Natronoarchaeum mannanilyticum TaxID=926360 RepID=A0AAV3TA19_9EURY